MLFYNARYYDPYLNRWIQPDSIVPNPADPQSLNRFTYARNNPVKYTDPTGHWTEDELAQALGEDWRSRYFGKGAVFEGRDALLAFLLSRNTTEPLVLELIRPFFAVAGAAHDIGIGFEDIDAIGGRVSVTGGAIAFGGASADVVLNLTTGEVSVYASPEGGFILGEGLTYVGGITLLRNLPSNDKFRGTFEAVGVVAGGGISGNVEGFWSGPQDDWFNPLRGGHGFFIGGGVGEALGVYGTFSYSWEAFREDVEGAHWFPHKDFNLLTAAGEVTWAFVHDVLLHPLWPWSPYRR